MRFFALVLPFVTPPLFPSLLPVFRTPWKRCCFSGDGEYIVAGSARQHALYIWEKSIGNLVKILHGTRGELLLDVAVSVLGIFSYVEALNSFRMSLFSKS